MRSLVRKNGMTTGRGYKQNRYMNDTRVDHDLQIMDGTIRDLHPWDIRKIAARRVATCMIHVIYFSIYGNCKNVADMIGDHERKNGHEVLVESGEIMTADELKTMKDAELPGTIFLACPVRRGTIVKQGRKWLEALAKEIGRRDAWRPKVAIVFTHRIAGHEFKITLAVKKLARKIHVSLVQDLATKHRASAPLASLIPAPPLALRVTDVRGPLEKAAPDQLASWLKEHADRLH